MDNVISLPGPTDLISDMKGPTYTGCSVIIDGRVVPKLRMIETESAIEFILDDRMCWGFPKEWAHHAASFAATAMAIGAGFPCFTADEKVGHFATPCVALDKLPES